MKDREQNRREFPVTAETVDMFRAAADRKVPGSGKGIRLLGATENQRTIGKLYDQGLQRRQ